MKRIYFFLTIVLIALNMSAQDVWQWPIQGQKVGTDILYRPQDYIEQEHNFDKLFIHAKEGTPVVCPADAIVTGCSLEVYPSLSYSISCSFDKSFDENVAEEQEDLQRKGIPKRYINVHVSLKIGDKTLHISGLRMDRALKTGVSIKQGEVIGTVTYAYKGIGQPHVMLSVDRRSALDPMTPFGLKSTFKVPTPVKPKEILTRAEAESDYRRMASSVREIYPSLTDLMTLQEYDAFVEEQISTLPEQISRKDFAYRLTLFNEKVHDSHIYIKKTVPLSKQTFFSPLFFAMFGDKCIVTMATKEYVSYVGREIVKIDGKPVAEISAITRRNSSSYDAQVESVREYLCTLWPCIDYGMANAPQKQGDKIILDFADGEHLVADLIPKMEYAKGSTSRWNRQANSRWPAGSSYITRMLNDSTFYIGLKTFHLSEVETDSVLWHIHQAELRHIPYLIFDVRNNPGGEGGVMEQIARALMGKMPDRPHISYQMANAAVFKSPISNYIAGDSIITWLHPVEGKQGIYSERRETHYEMDPKGYNGRLYVLIDSRSASASTFLAGCIKRNMRGAVVGRETQSAYHVETCSKFAWIDLPNSQFGINIPIVRQVIDETVSERLPAGRGEIPDYDIPVSYEEFIYDGDYILDQTLSLIAKGKYVEP